MFDYLITDIGKIEALWKKGRLRNKSYRLGANII